MKQDFKALRPVVKRALEIPTKDRLDLFDALGLFSVEIGSGFGVVQGIQHAFQRAHDLGKAKLGELTTGIERLYDETKGIPNGNFTLKKARLMIPIINAETAVKIIRIWKGCKE